MAVNPDLASVVAEVPREGERLAVEANLALEIDGRTFAVSSTTDRIRVHAPSVGACGVLLEESDWLPGLALALDQAGLTVELRTGDALLAVIGADASPGRVTETVVSEAVELRADGLFAGLLRLR